MHGNAYDDVSSVDIDEAITSIPSSPAILVVPVRHVDALDDRNLATVPSPIQSSTIMPELLQPSIPQLELALDQRFNLNLDGPSDSAFNVTYNSSVHANAPGNLSINPITGDRPTDGSDFITRHPIAEDAEADADADAEARSSSRVSEEHVIGFEGLSTDRRTGTADSLERMRQAFPGTSIVVDGGRSSVAERPPDSPDRQQSTVIESSPPIEDRLQSTKDVPQPEGTRHSRHRGEESVVRRVARKMSAIYQSPAVDDTAETQNGTEQQSDNEQSAFRRQISKFTLRPRSNSGGGIAQTAENNERHYSEGSVPGRSSIRLSIFTTREDPPPTREGEPVGAREDQPVRPREIAQVQRNLQGQGSRVTRALGSVGRAFGLELVQNLTIRRRKPRDRITAYDGPAGTTPGQQEPESSNQNNSQADSGRSQMGGQTDFTDFAENDFAPQGEAGLHLPSGGESMRKRIFDSWKRVKRAGAAEVYVLH